MMLRHEGSTVRPGRSCSPHSDKIKKDEYAPATQLTAFACLANVASIGPGRSDMARTVTGRRAGICPWAMRTRFWQEQYKEEKRAAAGDDLNQALSISSWSFICGYLGFLHACPMQPV